MTFRFNSVMFRFVGTPPKSNSSPLIYIGRNLKRERPHIDFQGRVVDFRKGRGDSMYS